MSWSAAATPATTAEHRQEQRGHGEGAGERQSGGGGGEQQPETAPPGRCGRRPTASRSVQVGAGPDADVPATRLRRPADRAGRPTAFTAARARGHRGTVAFHRRSACAASRSRIVSRPAAGSAVSDRSRRCRDVERDRLGVPGRLHRDRLARRPADVHEPSVAEARADRRQVERRRRCPARPGTAGPRPPAARSSPSGRRRTSPPVVASRTGRSCSAAAHSSDATISTAASNASASSDVATGVQHDDAPRLRRVDVLAHHQLPRPRRGLPVQVPQLVAGHVRAQRAQVHRPGHRVRRRCALVVVARPARLGQPDRVAARVDPHVGLAAGGLAPARQPEQVGALDGQRPDGNAAAPGGRQFVAVARRPARRQRPHPDRPHLRPDGRPAR